VSTAFILRPICEEIDSFFSSRMNRPSDPPRGPFDVPSEKKQRTPAMAAKSSPCLLEPELEMKMDRGVPKPTKYDPYYDQRKLESLGFCEDCQKHTSDSRRCKHGVGSKKQEQEVAPAATTLKRQRRLKR